MYKSETIVSNLLMEVDLLSYRIKNIKQAYCNTSHPGLRARLFSENKNISKRLNEIFLISKVLNNRNNEKVSFSSLLLEICERTIAQKNIEKNLFFL